MGMRSRVRICSPQSYEKNRQASPEKSARVQNQVAHRTRVQPLALQSCLRFEKNIHSSPRILFLLPMSLLLHLDSLYTRHRASSVLLHRSLFAPEAWETYAAGTPGAMKKRRKKDLIVFMHPHRRDGTAR